MLKEKSKIPISVSWEGGVQRFSGLLDAALAGGYVAKAFLMVGIAGLIHRLENWSIQKFDESQTLEEEFWAPVFELTDFADFLEKQYKIGLPTQVEMEEIVDNADD